MNQDPRTSPPALPPRPWQVADAIGYKWGLQSSEIWLPGASDSRELCDQRLAGSPSTDAPQSYAGLWRLSVFGHNVEVDVQFGTSRARQFKSLACPIQICVPGQLVVSVRPLPTNQGQYLGSDCMVTCTPVSSTGGESSNARSFLFGPAAPISDDAARFRATVASVITYRNTATCNLAATEWIPLIAGSVLTSGAGFVEYEP